MDESVGICICTYKREDLLFLLLEDISKQIKQPKYIIIVDGDPNSGKILSGINKFATEINLVYAPSNHANLAYQRYLGWKISSKYDSEFFIYFDDDLRLLEQNVISSILELFSKENVVGVTVDTSSKNIEKFSNDPVLIDRVQYKRLNPIKNFKRYSPGGYLPTGNRIPPKYDETGIAEVEWLQGRVMAYKASAIDQSCFTEDLFALTHINCGLGEDTFFSRQVKRNDKFLMSTTIRILHPDDALPNSYPIKAYRLGFATGYSRRFLNDHYRIFSSPHFTDRLALLKTYIGNNFLNIIRAIIHPARHRFQFSRGYFLGSIKGLFQKPTAKKLTPKIDWWSDAEQTLAQVLEIK